MQLKYSDTFHKNYVKRIAKNKALNKKFQERLELFLHNPKSPLLRIHKLVGAKKHLHAFSITGDVRVVYFQDEETLLLVDVGTHNQVY